MKPSILHHAARALALAAPLALAACAADRYAHRDPRPDAPICAAAAWAASRPLPPGSCVRLGWDIASDFPETPVDAFQFLCQADPADPAIQGGFCARAQGVSLYDKRQELAQLLACGRGARVTVDELWRFGDERYEGAEVLAFDGERVRVRWRGGQPRIGWTYQEILLESPQTAPGAGCRLASDDLPGEQIRRRLSE